MGWIHRIRDKWLSWGQKSFDPAVFNDPIALQTEWRSFFAMQSNFTFYTLVPIAGYGLIYRMSWAGRLFLTVFLVVGTATMGYFLHEQPEDWLFGALLGAVLVFFPVMYILYACLSPVSFNQQNRTFYARKGMVPFEQIHALQVLESYDFEDQYSHYQMNVVLKDASRLHVMQQYRLDRARAEIEEISALLGVPVWDTTRI